MRTGDEVVDVVQQGKILTIRFNNPEKKNCVNRFGYMKIGRALRAVAKDPTVTVVVLTGVGDFFTAGNDLTQSSQATDLSAYIRESNAIFREMVSALLDCPQVTIALVNGPSIGVGTTLAGICDMLWCVETAYFATPFTKLGIVPEACSSYLFPYLLGRSKATEMLIFSGKMSAAEAYEYKFTSRLFRPAELDAVIWPAIREYSEMPPGAMLAAKQLMRHYDRDLMYKALRDESDVLIERFSSEEFFNAVQQFAIRKNKSKL